MADTQKPLALAEPQDRAIVPMTENEAFYSMIERAARDPNVDVDKMERLLAMQERRRAMDAKAAYLAAMVLMKPELPIIDRKGRIEVREKTSTGKRDGDIIQDTGYARWEDIDEAITPILTKHQFTLTFRSGVAPDGKITVTGIISHTGGHSEETTITLPHDSSGSKNAVQAIGSSLSYGKRYAATFLLNIRTKGEDDDGAAAGGDGPISAEQLQTIRDLAERVGADIPAFCKYMSVEALPNVAAKDYAKAITALNLKLSHKKAAEK